MGRRTGPRSIIERGGPLVLAALASTVQADGITCAWRDIIGRYDLPSSTVTAVVDGTAYAVQGTTLQMLDVRDPHAPVWIGEYDLNDSTTLYDAAVYERVAYLVGHSLSMTMVDVSDPATPTLLGAYSTRTQSYDIDIVGSRAYLINAVDGLLILDISTPADPVKIGSFDTSGRYVDIAGDLAFIASGLDTGLEIVDISDPARPHLLAVCDVPALNVQVAAGIAYVAGGYNGVSICDVSDPERPLLIGSLETPDFARNPLQVVGDRLYVTDALAGMLVYHLADPSEPQPVGVYPLFKSGGGVVVGERAYLGGFTVIDVSTPPVSPLLASLETLRFARGIAVADGLVYLGDHQSLQIVDAHDPSSPLPLGAIAIPDDALDISVADSLVYIAASNAGLLIVDATEPDVPVQVGRLSSLRSARSVSVSFPFAFLVANGRLQLVDVTDPAAPLDAGSYVTDARALDLTLLGDLAYVGTELGLEIIDVRDPRAPVLLGRLDVGRSPSVSVGGTTACLTTIAGNLRFVDVAAPEAPVLVGEMYLGISQWGVAAALRDGLVYATQGEGSGLHVIDVADPFQPERVGWIRLKDRTWGLAIDESVAYVTDEFVGLHLIDITDQCAHCGADVNDDGVVDTRDFITYLDAWLNADGSADLDHNGVIDSRDFIAFLSAWSAGC